MLIKIEKNEFWYGGAVHFGIKMPLNTKSDTKVNLITAEGILDQCSPFFVSNKGRYIYSNKPFLAEFKNGNIEIAGEGNIEVSSEYKSLKEAHLAAAKSYFDLSGTIPNELFLKVPQYNTWIELMYNQNQKQIIEYAESLLKEGMEPGILMIDEGWAPDYGDYDFCRRKFDDPKKMVSYLHSLGFKVMLWVTPFISPDSDCYRTLRNTDYLIKDKNRKVAIREWWNGFSCVLDLTNPKACEWFKDKLDSVIKKYGVDGFKFDGGDTYMYDIGDKTFAISEPCEHSKAFDEFASKYEYNELRRVWNCGGKPLVCRLQDKIPSWDNEYGITSLIPNMLVQGILGYYFGCPDMVGGGAYAYFLDKNNIFDEELYIRWLEASILCPMIQFSISPKRILSKKSFEIVKDVIKLRKKYSDLIISLAKDSVKTGEPIMRFMEYEFPDEGFEQIIDQFMLGDKILVAPVTKKGENYRKVRLPKGDWKYCDGSVITGGSEVEVYSPIEVLPIFEKI